MLKGLWLIHCRLVEPLHHCTQCETIQLGVLIAREENVSALSQMGGGAGLRAMVTPEGLRFYGDHPDIQRHASARTKYFRAI